MGIEKLIINQKISLDVIRLQSKVRVPGKGNSDKSATTSRFDSVHVRTVKVSQKKSAQRKEWQKGNEANGKNDKQIRKNKIVSFNTKSAGRKDDRGAPSTHRGDMMVFKLVDSKKCGHKREFSKKDKDVETENTVKHVASGTGIRVRRDCKISSTSSFSTTDNDSKDTLCTSAFRAEVIELKITYKAVHRRVVVNERLSYNGLTREIESLFNARGPFSIYYEDDHKDIVKASSTREVAAMLRMTKKGRKTTHVFVKTY